MGLGVYALPCKMRQSYSVTISYPPTLRLVHYQYLVALPENGNTLCLQEINIVSGLIHEILWLRSKSLSVSILTPDSHIT